MINRGYHGNDASADPNMVAFVHPSPPANLPPHK